MSTIENLVIRVQNGEPDLRLWNRTSMMNTYEKFCRKKQKNYHRHRLKQSVIGISMGVHMRKLGVCWISAHHGRSSWNMRQSENSGSRKHENVWRLLWRAGHRIICRLARKHFKEHTHRQLRKSYFFGIGVF